MFRNMQLIFRSYEIQFLSSPCPSVQSICLKLYVKPSPCTGRGISSFPQSSNPKCYANFTSVATKSNVNVCHLNHLSRSHHHRILLCHLCWRSLEEGTRTCQGTSFISEWAQDVRGRGAAWCHKQLDRPLYNSSLRKRVAYELEHDPLRRVPLSCTEEMIRVLCCLLEGAFKRWVQRILEPWLLQQHTWSQTEDSTCAHLSTSICFLPLSF